MAERKVVNKYYPADFDPRKIPRLRMPNNQQINVRNMLPMTIQCKRCGSYNNKGTKFNMLKEIVIGEKYCDIQIYRFYFNCNTCSTDITFKTDPRNDGYTIGVTRNCKSEIDKKGESLENRTVDLKRKMDILSNLDELKSMQSRRAHVSNDAMIEAIHRLHQQQDKLEDKYEVMIKSIFHGSKQNTGFKKRKIVETNTQANEEETKKTSVTSFAFGNKHQTSFSGLDGDGAVVNDDKCEVEEKKDVGQQAMVVSASG